MKERSIYNYAGDINTQKAWGQNSSSLKPRKLLRFSQPQRPLWVEAIVLTYDSAQPARGSDSLPAKHFLEVYKVESIGGTC